MIYKLTKNSKTIELNKVGGKAYPLMILSKADINIPKGIVISTDYFVKFLKNNDIEKQIRELKKDKNISIKLKKIRSLIKNGEFSPEFILDINKNLIGYKNKFLSIRSSANVEDSKQKSFAGKFESYLGVSKKDVFCYIKKCYASVFTNKIIEYIDNIEKLKDIKMAVIIQVLVDSDVSGVCFTSNPLDSEEDDIIIEAIHGLGEYLVQGQIIPDVYIIERDTYIPLNVEFNTQLKLMKRKVNGGISIYPNPQKNEQKLNGHQMVQISNVAQLIERINGSKRDIEWSFKDNNLYILQSRPIVF